MAGSFDRKAARARCEAATPGPWASKAPMFGERWVGVHQNPADWDGMGFQAIASVLAHDHVKHNADLIAHARTDLPAALDLLDQQEAALWALVERWEERAEAAESGLVVDAIAECRDELAALLPPEVPRGG